jgi:hypothetical protein
MEWAFSRSFPSDAKSHKGLWEETVQSTRKNVTTKGDEIPNAESSVKI